MSYGYHHGPVMRTTPKQEFERGVRRARALTGRGDRHDVLRALQDSTTIREPSDFDRGYRSELFAWLAGRRDP